MTITLNTEYDVALSTALLGYVGETNARPVSVEGMEIDGADRYVMTIDYGDGVTYEVDITGGTWTPTADILRSAQTVSCQIAAKKLSGQEYILVKKSRIFRLRIGAAIGDTAIPSPDVAMDALDRIDAIGRQAHADMQTAVTAAETAQSIADSLPEDYVTAVGKIAENTAEISAVKLTDKELQRRVNALYDIGQGITHRFETDSSTAYAKTIPTGGKLMSVKNIGGRSIMWNQLVKPVPTVVTQAGVKFTFSNDGIITLNGTATTTGNAVSLQSVKNQKGHKYLMVANPLSGVYGKDQLQFSSQSYGQDSTGHGTIITNESSNEKWYYTLYVYEGVTYDNVKLQPQIYDLTAMFGSGNEPTTVEEFEKIFPADYYPYNAGEVVRTGVTEVAVGDTAYPIPEAIKALPGYGWSAGTARNYVDYENKQYVQCVQSVDLGTLSWVAGVGGKVSFQTSQVTGQKLTKNYSVPPNIICSKYSTKTQNELWGHINVTGITADANTDGYIDVNDTSYTDATAFKQAMQGVMLYYELETPIVTDISSLIPDDFLRNIEVEAKGSVTFKNSNGDDYRIPVPSEEEYIVKLSEVGGTT